MRSARIPPPEAVETALEGAKKLPEPERIVVERLAAKARYYAEAYTLARMVSVSIMPALSSEGSILCER